VGVGVDVCVDVLPPLSSEMFPSRSRRNMLT